MPKEDYNQQMNIELGQIDDERVHPATITTDYSKLRIYKRTDVDLDSTETGLAVGYVVVTGIDKKRMIESDSGTEFEIMLNEALQNSKLKIEII